MATISLRARPPSSTLTIPARIGALPPRRVSMSGAEHVHPVSPSQRGSAAKHLAPVSRIVVSSSATHTAPAQGAAARELESPPTVDLAILPTWSPPLPTSTGSLHVLDPGHAALLQVVQDVAASEGVPMRFGALPTEWVQRQSQVPQRLSALPASLAYLEDPLSPNFADLSLSTADKEVVGCSCQVEAVLQEPSGGPWSRLVRFKAVRRFRPLQVLRREPFVVVRCEWVDDDWDEARRVVEDVTAGELEAQLWAMIQEVVHLTATLRGLPQQRCCGGDDPALPTPVCTFSPHSSPPLTTAEERVRAWSSNPQNRMPAEVAVWRRMQPASGVTPRAAPVQAPVEMDPYRVASECLCRAKRQEAFSFAAAGIVELGPEQLQQLLAMTNTAERLHWLMQAVEPHLATLRAELSVRKALRDL